MIEVSDVFQAVVDKKPADFAQGFDELLKAKIADVVQNRKVELASDLFGAPEGLEDNDDEVGQDEETPNQEGDTDDGEKSEEGSEG